MKYTPHFLSDIWKSFINLDFIGKKLNITDSSGSTQSFDGTSDVNISIPDMNNYYTKSYIDNNYMTTDEIVSSYYDKQEIDNKIPFTIVNGKLCMLTED